MSPPRARKTTAKTAPSSPPTDPVVRQAWINLVGVIAGNVITAVAAVVGTLITVNLADDEPEPPVVDCIQRRDDALELIGRNTAWVPLPEDSVDQQECDINGYVKVLLEGVQGTE